MFAGFDLSLNGTGICVVDDTCTIILQRKFSPPLGSTGVERLFFLQEQLTSVLDQKLFHYACIEGPAYGRGEGGRLFELGEWAGIVKLNLFQRGIPFIIVTPMQLKKYVTGQGKGGKELIILDVFKNFKEEIRDNDIADAYVLARILHDLKYFETDPKSLVLKQYQQDVLKKLLLTYTLVG